MYKNLKKVITFLLLLSITVPALSGSTTAKAAAKPKLSYTKMEIGIGSRDEFEKYTIQVYNTVTKAKYSFSSSNAKVVTVKTSGSEGYLTGIKTGSAKITCTQTLNGKKTTVGICTVKVNKAKAFPVYLDEKNTLPLRLGKSENDRIVLFSFRNYGASYTFKSSSSDFKITEKKITYNGWFYYQMSYEAKEPGTYTITVNETFNKKTQKVGSFKVRILNASIEEESIELYAEDTITLDSLVSGANPYATYELESSNPTVAECKNTSKPYITAISAGTADVTVYEVKSGVRTKLGTVKVTVSEYDSDGWDSYDDYDDYDDDYYDDEYDNDYYDE